RAAVVRPRCYAPGGSSSAFGAGPPRTAPEAASFSGRQSIPGPARYGPVVELVEGGDADLLGLQQEALADEPVQPLLLAPTLR
ncbi:MAG TPA: hypothetical protein VJQ08_07505, partial [Candidatus Dormibacteraeota bacterium]|nr:hypothetical protein [Candidatus Dormibacteraeota bacterium]